MKKLLFIALYSLPIAFLHKLQKSGLTLKGSSARLIQRFTGYLWNLSKSVAAGVCPIRPD